VSAPSGTDGADGPAHAAPTPSQTVGPFFGFAFDQVGRPDLVPPGSPGSIVIEGRVLDGVGDPVPDAVVELWQADAAGRFPDEWGFGRCLTGPEGGYRFTTVRPGPVDAAQAPHVDLSVFARGLLQRLVTRVYFPDQEAANATDPVLRAVADPARRSTLVARAGDDPARLTFDVRLQGEDETVFFAW
jgi:protocatechuate 3,4-dioxygenase alpha subunit